MCVCVRVCPYLCRSVCACLLVKPVCLSMCMWRSEMHVLPFLPLLSPLAWWYSFLFPPPPPSLALSLIVPVVCWCGWQFHNRFFLLFLSCLFSSLLLVFATAKAASAIRPNIITTLHVYLFAHTDNRHSSTQQHKSDT